MEQNTKFLVRFTFIALFLANNFFRYKWILSIS